MLGLMLGLALGFTMSGVAQQMPNRTGSPFQVAHSRDQSPMPGASVAYLTGASDAILVLDRVTVLDVERGQYWRDQRVIIVGTRIRALGPRAAVPLPSGARVVDVRGKYLIPGLWDMHVHPLHYPEVAYPLFLANGITGIRDAGSDVSLATLNRWKQEILAGQRVGPRLFVAGPAVGSGCLDDAAHWVCVTTPAEARLMVDFLKQTGADFLKTYVLNSRELYFALAAEARRVGLPFGGHLPDGVDGLEASDSGARFLDHSMYLRPSVCGNLYARPTTSPDQSTKQCAAAAAHLRHNGSWVVLGPLRPRMLPYESALFRRYTPDGVIAEFGASRDSAIATLASTAAERAAGHQAGWTRPTSLADWKAALAPAPAGSPDAISTDSMPADLRLVETAGLPMLIGTDAALKAGIAFDLPGFSLPQSLVALVLRGMSPLGALQMATRNPALALGASDSLGTVATGKLADLALLDADPLQDIWNVTRIRAVVANGCYFDRAALDQLLAKAEQSAHQP